MPLAAEDKTEILQLIRSEFPQLGRPAEPHSLLEREMELRERMVRVEEELKRQRELMIEGFRRMDERFEDLIRYILKHWNEKILMKRLLY